MKIDVATVIGKTKYLFHIEEQKDKEALHKAAVLGNPPKYCQLCKNNEHFTLNGNKDKEGNIYIKMTCKKCGSQAKLGSYKVGGYFWHTFEQWQKNGQKQQETFDETEVENIGDAI